MGQMTAKTKDTQFEAEVLRADPAIKRFRSIKAMLVKHGHGPKLHAKDCICLCCIEGKIEQILKSTAK
jgi:hypothetical protein